MEVAHSREQHWPPPRESSTPYISQLSTLELTIVKYAAVLSLTRSPLKDSFDLDEMVEMIETKRGNLWSKLSKGDKGLMAAGSKKKGVFGVPLEVLVEREGTYSRLGDTSVFVRVPSFIEDVISAIKTMGSCFLEYALGFC